MMQQPTWWTHRGLGAQLLRPLSWLYRLGFLLDRARTTTMAAPLPVIAIGNVTAGGAGKTPTSIAVAQMLRNMGVVPHIVSRGYGGRITHTHRVDPAVDSAADVGDEPLLLAQHAPTWVGSDRHASCVAAKAAGASVIVADDAMQHHRLQHDLVLLVVDGSFGFGNGLLLPAGPLREPLSHALARPHVQVLQIGGETLHPALPAGSLRATLQPAMDTGFLAAGKWLAFAGIARPQKFYATLQQCGATLAATRDFPDHHAFTPAELDALLYEAQAQGLQLITTEKDAQRIAAPWRAQLAVLPVALALEDEDALRSILTTTLAHARRA